MIIYSDGWLYKVPEEAAFLEVTSQDGERATVVAFTVEGLRLPPLDSHLVPAPEHWTARVQRAFEPGETA